MKKKNFLSALKSINLLFHILLVGWLCWTIEWCATAWATPQQNCFSADDISQFYQLNFWMPPYKWEWQKCRTKFKKMSNWWWLKFLIVWIDEDSVNAIAICSVMIGNWLRHICRPVFSHFEKQLAILFPWPEVYFQSGPYCFGCFHIGVGRPIYVEYPMWK